MPRLELLSYCRLYDLNCGCVLQYYKVPIKQNYATVTMVDTFRFSFYKLSTFHTDNYNILTPYNT